MLQEQMRITLLFILSFFMPFLMRGQVLIDQEIRLNGAEGLRGVDSIAPPTLPTSAITVESSVLGIAHWADAVLNSNSIELVQPIPATEYRAGMLLRFICPADLDGTLLLRSQGLEDLPLLRADGLAPFPGQLVTGTVVEIVHAVDRWIIISPQERGCPPGTATVHEHLCMDVNSTGPMSIYAATDHCLARGGKLCTWDEYYLSCTVLDTQLENMFSSWEWLDETSNHVHTADQAGRYSCKSQRSVNPVLIQGKARCCYHPK